MTDHFLLAQIVAVIIFHNSFVFIEVSFFCFHLDIIFQNQSDCQHLSRGSNGFEEFATFKLISQF